MSKFDGHVRDLGDIPAELLTALVDKVSDSAWAHAQVPPHVDANPSSLVPHKVHVPLITNPSVTFVIDGERHHLALGRAYEINNLLMHSVENAGDLDRVHVIFEIYPTGVATSGAVR